MDTGFGAGRNGVIEGAFEFFRDREIEDTHDSGERSSVV